jgi:antitoxin ParD1/3/4
MTLQLSEEVERLIEEKVESGRYRSPNEVVTLALNALEEQDHALGERALAFKAEIDSRLASGPATPLDFSALKKSFREGLATREARPR